MAPKRRQTNKHLPPRVYIKHSAYWYVTLENKWIRLGKTLAEAMDNWTKMVNPEKNILTMNQLINRYMTEIAPTKSSKSYRNNIYNEKSLRVFFGEMKPADVTPVEIYRFLDIRGKKTPIAANREKALLSHIFSMGIRWGIVGDNPCRNVKRIPERPRDRYIDDKEFLAVYKIASPFIRNLMNFALITGQRIGDILKIKHTDMTSEGIRIEQNKTKAKILISWSRQLKRCVHRVKNNYRKNIHPITLFCTQKGAPVVYEGFSSIWQRTIKKAIDNKLIQEPFTFHDIRAKASSDGVNRQQVSDLLGHADIKITERIYNRKEKKVVPIR